MGVMERRRKGMIQHDPTCYASSLIDSPREHLGLHMGEVRHGDEPNNQSRTEDRNSTFHSVCQFLEVLRITVANRRWR
jgi:hypothetical protein